MQGTRRDITDDVWNLAQVWDYGKLTYETGWHWYCCVASADPDDNGVMWGNLSNHEVIEHEDKTISVSPSILIGQRSNKTPWHGYLELGVWREV